MNNGRTELAQFILNDQNAPIDVLLMTIRFVKQNMEDGPKIAAELEAVLKHGDWPWIS